VEESARVGVRHERFTPGEEIVSRSHMTRIVRFRPGGTMRC
jgi:hypothetical protein